MPFALNLARRARAVVAAFAGGACAAGLAATPPADAPQEPARPPDCADRPLPAPIRELALPADQLARVAATLRAACEREQQAREADRRALAAVLGPERMARVEGRLRPPPPPGPASAPCRREDGAAPAGRRP